MTQTMNPRLSDSPTGATPAVSYEERLARDSRWALSEGSRFFEGKSAVQGTLLKIAARLDELAIDYAVAGGMALFLQGFRRFTEDIDILVTRENLKTIHEKLEGAGYLPVFAGSKNLRDVEHGVRIEFLITGDFPGDGLPKPVVFPDPKAVYVEKDGIRFLNLPALVELKLASGMSNPERLKDLADVQELIRILKLSAEFEENLNPFVRPKFRELINAAHPSTRRYVLVWDNGTENAQDRLQQMLAEGINVDAKRLARPNHLLLTTYDPALARKFNFHDEAEFLEKP